MPAATVSRSSPAAASAASRSSSTNSSKPFRARLNPLTLAHHRPKPEDTPIPMRLRSHVLIRSPESPFHRRSISPTLPSSALP